ncbi:hypothetical protein EVAR_63873_1 [Eumeta japonica]|uniref:Uncharacterized protein n=1 Tax=Eumeta variegata TaxID=151549 RepID=A0A4C1ZWX6_EUMVA|nr:hypothetical protein EVAR_63873_1 [Eumeta japonica]
MIFFTKPSSEPDDPEPVFSEEKMSEALSCQEEKPSKNPNLVTRYGLGEMLSRQSRPSPPQRLDGRRRYLARIGLSCGGAGNGLNMISISSGKCKQCIYGGVRNVKTTNRCASNHLT